jgi:2-methylisocitrate lyase-like PEP mutase family enzyme
VVNVVIGGKTPALPVSEFARMGFGMVLYANAALQGAVRGMTNALGRLQQQGILQEDPALVATFAERQALVHKEVFDQLDRRYGS